MKYGGLQWLVTLPNAAMACRSTNADTPLNESNGEGVPECPFEIINEWRYEANSLAEHRQWDVFRAFDHVIMKYLFKGSSNPICDLVLNLKRSPAKEYATLICKLIDTQFDTNGIQECDYYIQIERNRGRGRPSATELDPNFIATKSYLDRAIAGAREGKSPDYNFWYILACAFDFKEYNLENSEISPVRAALIAKDPSRGRRSDPSRLSRNHFIWTKVDLLRCEGEKYDSAIQQVYEDIIRARQAEGGDTKFSKQAVRDAYDEIEKMVNQLV